MRQYPAGQELAELLLHEARQRGAVRVMSRRLRLYIGFRWRGVRLSAGADRARPASGGAGVAVGQDRLRLLADGRVVLTLKSAWRDGTRRLLFELLTLLEKLAALIPRPRINLVVYPGVLAPHCGWRARVVAYGAPPAVASPCSEAPRRRGPPRATGRGRR